MDTGRLKTIVILILLCVNLAFGGILLSEKLGAAEGNAQARSELRSVLAGLGITVADDQIPAGGVMFRRSVPRLRETEDRLVTALLGDAAGQDQGGNIWYYENTNGWAWCRGGGSFEIMVLVGGGSLEEQMEKGGLHARREGEKFVCLLGNEQVQLHLHHRPAGRRHLPLRALPPGGAGGGGARGLLRRGHPAAGLL